MGKLRVGIVGWRGMVGSVLMGRMVEEHDLELVEPVFFSTSQAGIDPPDFGVSAPPVGDASDVDALSKMEVIVSCQGGDYTSAVHPALRNAGWRGHWIDAASTLRMKDSSVIILDPLNRARIDEALSAGVLDFIGGNCTVSLMLMAVHGLLDEGWVEWISSMTYQAASGAGAVHMKELVRQMGAIAEAAGGLVAPEASVLELDRQVSAAMRETSFPHAMFGHPLAGSLLPWIDREVEHGQSREEWKGMAEANKILGTETHPIAVDGTCVRIGAMRCHSQGLTIRLHRDVPLDEIEAAIAGANPWVELVPNDKDATLARLTPTAVSGTLGIAVGRVRKTQLGPRYLNAFTVGDQLMWGAAEPLRRMLRILLERRG